MSIEGNNTATTKAVAGPAGHGGKGRATAGDEAEALAAGGFLALLTSLEPEAAVDTAGTDATALVGQLEASDTRPLPEGEPQGALTNPSAPVPQNLPTDLAMLLAQAGQVAVNQLPAEGTPQAAGVPDTAALVPLKVDVPVATPLPLAPTGVPDTAALVPLKTDVPVATPLPLAPAGQVAVDKLATTVIETGKPNRPVVVPPALAISVAAEPPVGVSPSVDALLAQTAQGTQVRTPKIRATELRSGADSSLGQTRVLQQSFTTEKLAREPALSGMLGSSGMADSLLRPLDRGTAKSSFSVAGAGAEGLWGHTAFQAGSRLDVPSAMANPSTLSLESMVADKVSYWVTQGVKNAALTLDGFGSEPLEVSISLKGGEAHINFRTDQPEIRQMLEGAAIQLKDILRNEGVLLSGVSVGTSGQDGAGTQERRNRQDTRQTTIATQQVAVPTQGTQRASQTTGRAIDLFV